MAKWRTLEHNGVLFPPAYEPSGTPVMIRGKKTRLSPLQEEMAYQWAKKKDTPYVQDETFRKNFVKDFAKELGSSYKGLEYGQIDFGPLYRLVDREKAAREAMTPEQRKAQASERKEARESLKSKYGTAQIDGKPVELGNYMIEPPGIFIGRGDHPLRGRWKPRITEGDVTLNLGRGARTPPGKWAGVACEADSVWVAKWTDKLTGHTKYVWLADTSELKQDMDRAKYDKAVRLSDNIGEVVSAMVSDMGGRDKQKARIATACYLIYRTSMRVGDEKDEDEADTVGATTLRREHVRVTKDSVEFDFLGKDSVRWQETVKATGHDEQFRLNMLDLAGGKRAGGAQEIFDGISSRHVNAYYSGIMKGLSAKVFRTYLATREVAGYLRSHDGISSQAPAAKIYHAKMANLQAAIMCNHKRTIPKTFELSLQKRKESLGAAREAARRMRGEARAWRSSPAPAVRSAEEAVEAARAALRKARAAKPKKGAKKGAGTKKSAQRKKRLEAGRARLKKRKEQAARRAERLDARADRGEARAEKLHLEVDFAGRTRDYNIGTSLRNYIDPRVFKSWMDEVGAEWPKLYTASLARKFRWVESESGAWKDVSGWY